LAKEMGFVLYDKVLGEFRQVLPPKGFVEVEILCYNILREGINWSANLQVCPTITEQT
jgi:hypothetical protein